MNEDQYTRPAADGGALPLIVSLWELSLILDHMPAQAMEARRKAEREP